MSNHFVDVNPVRKFHGFWFAGEIETLRVVLDDPADELFFDRWDWEGYTWLGEVDAIRAEQARKVLRMMMP